MPRLSDYPYCLHLCYFYLIILSLAYIDSFPLLPYLVRLPGSPHHLTRCGPRPRVPETSGDPTPSRTLRRCLTCPEFRLSCLARLQCRSREHGPHPRSVRPLSPLQSGTSRARDSVSTPRVYGSLWWVAKTWIALYVVLDTPKKFRVGMTLQFFPSVPRSPPSGPVNLPQVRSYFPQVRSQLSQIRSHLPQVRSHLPTMGLSDPVTER